MKLFHYHHWTNAVEETENFYEQLGFKVAGRFGTDKNYHPPLTWDDFRDEQPIIRIVEMRKGRVNVTFGAGKRPMFDHLGFLVTEKEHEAICERAEQLGWRTRMNERRTFMATPFRVRFELQMNVNSTIKGNFYIKKFELLTQNTRAVQKLPFLFGRPLPELSFTEAAAPTLAAVSFAGEKRAPVIDPNGVRLNFSED